MKSIAKDWLPPVVLRALRQVRGGGIRFEGKYTSWEEAAALCTGYDADSILAKVLEATLKVKRGEAAYERDSVLLGEIEYSWPVTASLMWAAAQRGGRLDVLDFGGALGSSYFQNRAFLADLLAVRWSVIEQGHYVRAGRENLADDHLCFYDTPEQCLADGRPDIVVLSSVLQYLADPKLVLGQLAGLGAQWLIIDRTPFLNSNCSSYVKVQRVPPSIYSASYPCWFFNLDELTKHIKGFNYQKVEIFDSLDKLFDQATWRGLIFKKVSNQQCEEPGERVDGRATVGNE